MPGSSSKWVSDFLSERGLSKPDGRPLYGYRSTKEEFDQLAALLKECSITKPTVAKLFVLYASEWLRRRYEGGSWNWEDIFDSIEWPKLDPYRRQEITRKGLSSWKRSLDRYGSGSTAYLMTLVTEGGFPVRLVDRPKTHLSRYLKAVLNDYVRYASAGMSAERIAESHEHYLPHVFRKQVVYQLASDCIRAVYELSEKVGDSADPYQALEDGVPDWKDTLPLSFESHNARRLINGLLQHAKETRRNGASKLKIKRFFESGGDGALLHKAVVELPHSIPIILLSDELGRHEDALPRALELAVFADGKLTRVASLSKDQKDYYVYPYSSDSLRLSLSPSSSATCTVLESGGERFGEIALAGGEGLDEDMPVVCYEDEGQFVVIGQGTIKSRFDHIYASMPEGSDIEEGAENCRLLDSKLSGIHDGGRWGRISGNAVLRLDDGFKCRWTLDCNEDGSADFIVRGERRYLYEQKNMPMYLGFPLLYKSGDLQRRLVEHKNIYWSPIGKAGGWLKYASGPPPYGGIRVRVVEDGESLYSGRFVVLPEDFQIDLEPDPSMAARKGRIIFNGLSGAKVIPSPDVPIRFNIASLAGEADVECESASHFAGKIPVDLVWPDLMRCQIMVPFPGKGASFVGVQGKKLLSSEAISLNDLVSISAVSVTFQSHARFSIHGELRAADVNHISRSLTFFRSMPEISPGYFEYLLVDLYSAIRELFSYSAALDARVVLEISSGGFPLRRIEVVQFDSELYFDSVNSLVVHQTISGEPNEDSVEIRLIPMADYDAPDIEGAMITMDGSYGWRLNRLDASTTPALAVASGAAVRSIRPCVVEGDSLAVDDSEGFVDSLHNLLAIRHAGNRMDRLNELMATLSGDPGHEWWYDVLSAVRRFSEVHPDSIDLYEVFIDNPEACSGLMVRMTSNDLPQLLDWENFLPFRWWQVPIPALLSAYEKYRKFCRDSKPEHYVMLLKEAKSRLEEMAHKTPGAEATVDIVLSTIFEQYEAKGDVLRNAAAVGHQVLFETFLNGEARDMFSKEANSRWPTGLERSDWHDVFKITLPWLDDGNQHYRRPFLDAVIAQAYSVVSGCYLDREKRAFICATHAFSPATFEKMLTMAVSYFHLEKRLAALWIENQI